MTVISKEEPLNVDRTLMVNTRIWGKSQFIRRKNYSFEFDVIRKKILMGKNPVFSVIRK